MTETPATPPNSLTAAILRIARLLESDPPSAAEHALMILKKAPGQKEALALLIAARRLTGDLGGARDAVQAMVQETPNLAALQCELGALHRELGDSDAAIAAFSRAVELEPLDACGWRALAEAFAKTNRAHDSARAYAKFLELSVPELQRLEAAVAAELSQLPAAEGSLCEWLQKYPTDVFTRQLLGTVYLRLARHEEAAQQLSKALEFAPNHPEARFRLAGTFVYRGDWNGALEAAEKLLEDDPEDTRYLDLKAFSLLRLGEFEAAASAYEALLAKHPDAESWKTYGQALKTLGRTEEAIAAYRQSIARSPNYGLGYWCLAELKTFRFEPSELDAMKRASEAKDIGPRDRALIHFALGRAYEDAQDYESSFEQFRRANATMRSFVRHNPDQRANFVQHSKAVFTPEYFRARAAWGTPRDAPIFIVGLPRSGSTLIEQILASHSKVEATSELQILESVIRDLSMGEHRQGRQYPYLMQDLSAEQVRRAGEEYLAGSLPYRKINRPYFTDKMPNNFSYLGMILTALPNAKIIDARRHPLGGGFAIYKHYFVDAYTFAFDLADIGRYYRRYVELMAHFDRVQPGRVHRVIYENMVADPEGEIRKLLDYCGLPFEEACLTFYESRRAVLTPSAEQVRQPVYAQATELWLRYERWLDPLKSVLGDVLGHYPEAPNFPESVPSTQWSVSRPIRWSSTTSSQ
ncbi:MAG TPA: sulfotransferase [Rhizomicrobium sp.]|jgi:tetratricopeptide (TPR) repeat protein|nr:sulfotransferase [Rhizomicrobium sp.]